MFNSNPPHTHSTQHSIRIPPRTHSSSTALRDMRPDILYPSEASAALLAAVVPADSTSAEADRRTAAVEDNPGEVRS